MNHRRRSCSLPQQPKPLTDSRGWGTYPQLTESIDCLPTLLDLVGIDIPRSVQGKSMAPLLRGQTESHRDYVFAEGGHEPDLLAIEILPESHNAVIAGYQLKAQLRHQCRESLAKAKMIRTATSKLVYRITGDHEYYDLTTDPEEMTNLYGQPETAAETARLTTILLDHLITSEQNLPFDPHPIA